MIEINKLFCRDIKMLLWGILLFHLSQVLCSCSRTEVSNVACDIIKTIDVYPDSSYFSDIRCMQYYNEKVYLLDAKRRDIAVLDSGLRSIEVLGTVGDGPEDFQLPLKFYMDKDTLYLLDAGSGSVKAYCENRYITQYKLLSALDERFVKANDRLYIPCVTDTSSILSFSINDSVMNTEYLGELFSFDSGRKVRLLNNRKLLQQNGFLYAVSDNQFVVEKYDVRNGNSVEQYNFSGLELVRKNREWINGHSADENSYYVSIEDVYIQKNKMYLLSATFIDDYKSNTVLELDIVPAMKIVRAYTLPGKNYRSICVSPNHCLYAFNTNCTIEKIKLKRD